MKLKQNSRRSISTRSSASRCSAPRRATARARAVRGRTAVSPRRVVVAEKISNPRPPVQAPIAAPVRERYDGDTAYRLYLREISETPLLTPAEEIQLAARIKRGDKSAREHMIKANLRLVVKIAHDYENYGLPLLDLINEGNMGLMKAVERFDPAKGGKLSRSDFRRAAVDGAAGKL